VDWCCFPYLESPSVFAGILDQNNGGKFLIQPNHLFQSAQKYVRDTNVLETNFFSVYGNATLTDFMPIKNNENEKHLRQAIFRRLECTSGRMIFKVLFSPKFNYGRAKTVLQLFEDGVEAYSGNNEHIYFYAPQEMTVVGDTAVTKLRLKQDETAWFVLRYNTDYRDPIIECEQGLNQTVKYWRAWATERASSSEVIFSGLGVI
jgi:GH15 family glucan-1,4-alpha-glucosidase